MCLTTTLNNLGLIKKTKGKFNEAAKYLKQTLDLEKAVMQQIQISIEELNESNIIMENPYGNKLQPN